MAKHLIERYEKTSKRHRVSIWIDPVLVSCMIDISGKHTVIYVDGTPITIEGSIKENAKALGVKLGK